MPRYAIRLAYDGSQFHGSQRQPSERTVEGELLDALARAGVVAAASRSRFQTASRTDSGVSAAENVAAFDTDFPRQKLLAAINGNARDVWAYSIVNVPDAWNPRHARERTYRYVCPAAGLDDRLLADALQLFVGEHDFTSFCRLEEGDDPRMRIESISLHDRGALVLIDLSASHFLWHQVRRVVEACRRMAAGEVHRKEIEGALSGERLDLGIAPAENLLLLRVDTGLAWENDEAVRSRVLSELAARLHALALRREVLASVHDAIGGY